MARGDAGQVGSWEAQGMWVLDRNPGRTTDRRATGPPLDRRAVLRLTGLAAAGLLVGACRDGGVDRPEVEGGPLSPTALLSVRDTFERSDGPIGLTETGQPWEEIAGTWTVRSGLAKATPSYRSQVCTAVVDAGAANGRLEVLLRLSPTRLRANAGVVFRCVDGNNNLFVKLERTPLNPQGLMSIGKKQGASVTYLRSIRSGIAFDSGDAVTVVVDLDGPNVRVHVSTGERLAHTLDPVDVTAYGSVTRHGLRINTAPDDDDGGSSFDNMSFTPFG